MKPRKSKKSISEIAAKIDSDTVRCWERLLMEIPLFPAEDHYRRAQEIVMEEGGGAAKMNALISFILNYREFHAIHYRLARAVQPTGKKIKPISPIAGAIVTKDETRFELANRLLDREISRLVGQNDMTTAKEIKELSKKTVETHRNYRIWVFLYEMLEELPLPQNLWVKTGIIALRSGARFLEVAHNRPIREWV
jgi:hypothetical protein